MISAVLTGSRPSEYHIGQRRQTSQRNNHVSDPHINYMHRPVKVTIIRGEHNTS